MATESTPLQRFVDGVRREAEALISNQPDAAGRAAAGRRLIELADAAIAEEATTAATVESPDGASSVSEAAEPTKNEGGDQ